MRLRVILASALMALSVSAGWAANAHYVKGCSNVPLVTGGNNSSLPGGGVIYIDDRPLVWIYAETNGHAGYQSGGTSIIDETDIDGCYNHNCIGNAGCPRVESDALII